MNADEVGEVPIITLQYDPIRLLGTFTLSGIPESSIWERLRARVLQDEDGREPTEAQLVVPWVSALSILRDFGTKQQQSSLKFRFRIEGEAQERARRFADELRQVHRLRGSLSLSMGEPELLRHLSDVGFTKAKRELRSFQVRDLLHLLSLPHGANFSVPGAGKTTVTFALNLVLRQPEHQLMVVGPKASFPAWMGIVEECIDDSMENAASEPFVLLSGSERENEQLLQSSACRFVMSYDLMIRQEDMLASHFARRATHLVLDEAHRMKAGIDSQRGAFLLSVAPLLTRRDILTGTPMPQGPHDLASQLAFLWPGQGLNLQIERGEAPRQVLGNLYVRTTKSELGLPKAKRHYVDVAMLPGQQALYAVVRNEALRVLVRGIHAGKDAIDVLRARRSVMRLLQLSSNPTLALRRITEEMPSVASGIVDAVIEEGASSKLRAVIEHARMLASANKKVVIWTIFTETITDLEVALADLNPVSIYGLIPSGDSADLGTREGRLKRFHEDGACMLLIGNPAAAGEGISLHMVCHDAIYVDRSYVSTHYLQSIDRIHRLGLPAGVETNIFIYRTKAPAELGSIDYSVGRRLATKIRQLQQLLDDDDLHEIAFDEEMSIDPIDYSVDMQDLIDLVEELEGKGAGQIEEDE